MKKIKHQVNNYRTRKVEDINIVTTDHGSWVFLNDEEIKKLKNENLTETSKNLINKLENTGILITEKNKEKIISETQKRFHYLFKGTSLHIVVPTLRCNYQCTYCHASSKNPRLKKFDMNKETAKKTADFILQGPSENITIEFQGGEPLLNFDIIKFITSYTKLKNKNNHKQINFTLVSNLSLLNNEMVDFFVKNNFSLCTSLDGPKKVHDFNRKSLSGNGSYEETIKKIKMVQKKININALATITKNSLNHPKEIVDEYVKLGLDIIHLRFINNLGYAGKVWEEISYTPEEFVEFWKKSLDYIVELNKKGIKIKERGAAIILQKIFSYDPSYLDLRNPCGAAIGQLLYNYDGKIFTCDEGRMVDEDIFKIGSVNQKYKDVLTCPETCAVIAASINDTTYCDLCAYKPYCGLCPVCNFSEHGNILAQIPATRRCKIFMAQFDYIFKLIKDKKNLEILKSWIQ